MRIEKVLNFNFKQNNNYQSSAKNNKTSFKGYVNGKYFNDEVILEAKKALKNPNWKKELLARKRSLEESFTTWHKREGADDTVCRVLMGVFTLGLTEITWGLAQAAIDALDNNSIDKKIKEIEDCLDNMYRGGY